MITGWFDDVSPVVPIGCGVVRWLMLAAALCAGAPGCRGAAQAPPPPKTLTIAVGFEGSVSSDVGTALAANYQRGIPGVRVLTRFGRGVDGSLEAVKSGDADLGFVDAEGAYIAYRQGKMIESTESGLRAIAVLYPTAVQIFARRRLNIVTIDQLKGQSIVVGESGGYADRAMQLILETYKLDYSLVHPIFLTGPEAVEALGTGEAAAIVFYTPLRRRQIADLVAAGDFELLPLSHQNIARIQATSERNHFIKTITIPGGTYEGQPRDVLTMGEDILLVCRADLDESLVYSLTRTLFDSTAELVRAHPAAGSINAERGPTTSLPLHDGAARYYRERELPR